MELRDPTELGQTRACLPYHWCHWNAGVGVLEAGRLVFVPFTTKQEHYSKCSTISSRHTIRNDHWHNYCSRLMCAKIRYNLTRFQFKFLLTNQSGTLLLTSIFIAGFVARWLQSKLLEYSKLLVGRCARTIGSGKVTSALKRLVIGYVYNYRIVSPRTCLKLYIWENVVCCMKRQTDRHALTRKYTEHTRTFTHRNCNHITDK